MGKALYVYISTNNNNEKSISPSILISNRAARMKVDGRDCKWRELSNKGGGFSNQTDDSDSGDEDAILADLKEKWKTVEGNGRITDDATLSDILEVDAELLTASYPTDEEILKSLIDNNKGQENNS
ncbi:hypothetical protein AVEN_265378-1 [Araneus ventricosus]|uniref:DDE-1 domain-containing protein n=1 Tax=Araneus ventricosus TaxID=182803 RepID=A0A4Y2IR47_ARAVE|nr:hypothetical protein AVEN_265378-1 [Araneus ventricosus]